MNTDLHPFDDEDDALEERGPSRSQQKRDHKALRDLVRALIALPPNTVHKLPLEPLLVEQLIAAKQLVPKALNREIRYLTRKLVDADPEALRAVLYHHRQPHKTEVKALHAAERLRDELIEGDDSAMGRVCERHPAVDRQQVRQLVRAARKEAAAERPPSSARKLFKLLHALETERDKRGE